LAADVLEIGVLYSTVMGQGETSRGMLEMAVKSILEAASGASSAQVLWNLRFTRALSGPPADIKPDNVLSLPETGEDLAFDEDILHKVMEAWRLISGETDGFMSFEDREGADYEEAD
jgi:hypothetical protein